MLLFESAIPIGNDDGVPKEVVPGLGKCVIVLGRLRVKVGVLILNGQEIKGSMPGAVDDPFPKKASISGESRKAKESISTF